MLTRLEKSGHIAAPEYVFLENQDYIEDKLIALCDDLARAGIRDIELASGLLFTLHYVISKQTKEDAEKSYAALLEQYKTQITALQEFYETVR